MTDTPNLQFAGFGIADYRSFDEEGFVLEDLRKINVFIGKNNSGKSNIIRAIRLLKRITKPKMRQGETRDYDEGLYLKPEIDSHDRNGKPPSVTVNVPLERLVGDNQNQLNLLKGQLGKTSLRTRWNTSTGAATETFGLEHLDDRMLLGIHHHLTNSSYSGRPSRKQLFLDVQAPLLENAVGTLRCFDRLVCVENFREIRQVSDAPSDSETFNGYNVIPLLREMQVPPIGKDPERKIFDRIQDFVRNLLGEPNLLMEVPTSEDVIILNLRNRLPLESYGTGVHQLVILCAALAMHNNYIVCIEEPEIHIHPELQRKFLRFIAKETNNTYFITTHSNVFLDFLPDVALYHVTHDGQKSTVTRVEATPAARNVLADLGYKASDLLQANCVIWVEGPSDRIYLNKWLSLIAPDLIEGIHYSITFYGGSVRAHFTAVDDPEDDLVEVLRINQHAIFVMDRDDTKPSGKLSATKERILEELGEAQCWVTAGREIENYLRRELIEQYLTEKYGESVKIKFTRRLRLEKVIVTATENLDGPPVNYANAKVKYAREFCELMDTPDLDVADLHERLTQIVELIRKWNDIDTQ